MRFGDCGKGKDEPHYCEAKKDQGGDEAETVEQWAGKRMQGAGFGKECQGNFAHVHNAAGLLALLPIKKCLTPSCPVLTHTHQTQAVPAAKTGSQ